MSEPVKTPGIWKHQVKTIVSSSETTDEEIEELQVLSEMDLHVAQILGHVMADTVPEKYELEQSSSVPECIHTDQGTQFESALFS